MSAYTLTMFWDFYNPRLTDKAIASPQDVIPLVPPWLRRRASELSVVPLEGALTGVKTVDIGSVRVAYFCPQCKAYYGGPPRMEAHNNIYSFAGWQGYQLTCVRQHLLGNQIERRG